MTIKELHRLIREGESQTLDFKKTVSRADKIAKTLVAFANTKGGKLLIGVLDDGRIMGANTNEEAYMLRQAAEHHCRPPVYLSFMELADEEGREVLLVDVPESRQKPHEALLADGTWRSYLRMHDHSVLASRDMVLLMRKGVEGGRKPLGKEGRAVVAYLERAGKVTVKLLAQQLNISERRARKLLVDMCQDGWLLSHGFEKETFYTLLEG